MSLEKIPPIIVALDTDSHEDSLQIVEDLGEFEPEEVGFKISQPDFNFPDLTEKIKSNGGFIVLDTRLHDDVDHMARILKRHLDVDPDLLPDAVTLMPFFKTSSLKGQRVKNRVFDKASEKGVSIIGYSGEVEQETGLDGNAVLYEAVCFMNARDIGFAGFEIYAANFLNSRFLDEVSVSVTAAKRSGQRINVNYDSLTNEEWPLVIGSKFNLPISVIRQNPGVKYGNYTLPSIPSTDEKKLGQYDIKITEEQRRQRALMVAGHIFRLSVGSIYLGNAIVSADSADRKRHIQKVLDIRKGLGSMSVEETLGIISESCTYKIRGQATADGSLSSEA